MKAALVLSGGGLRGAAHVGVLQVMVENGLKPDLVVGTSAGAIVATLYAAGISPGKMAGLLQFLRWPPWNRQLEVDSFTATRGRLTGLPLGLFKGNHIEKFLTSLTGGKSFDKLELPAAVVATDLSNGQAVVFTTTRLLPQPSATGGFKFIGGTPAAEAVRASIAIPGIFSPKAIGSLLLVDGGLVDNVPADVARFLGAEQVAAVDLGFAVTQVGPFHNMLEVLLQTYDIMGQRIVSMVNESCADFVLRPQTGSVALWEAGKVPALLTAGREEALRNLSRLKQIFHH